MSLQTRLTIRQIGRSPMNTFKSLMVEYRRNSRHHLPTGCNFYDYLFKSKFSNYQKAVFRINIDGYAGPKRININL